MYVFDLYVICILHAMLDQCDAHQMLTRQQLKTMLMIHRTFLTSLIIVSIWMSNMSIIRNVIRNRIGVSVRTFLEALL